MIDYSVIFAFALAYLVAYSALPLIRVFAFKLNAVDIPKDKRRMHKRPIPLLGGIAIYLGFIVSVACFTAIIETEILGILIGSLIIVVIGALDDLYDLRPIVKLLGQILAAAVAIYFGARIRIFYHPFNVGGKILDLSWLSIPATFVWIVIMTNAINLIDGLDGLAASVSGISAIALLFLCVVSGNTAIAAPLAAVAGGCFGFLPYNKHPAKIFMGDSGALFLGYILSTLSVTGLFRAYSIVTYIVPVIVLGVPIFDTSFAILRRIKSREGIMHADRGHLHHRLIDMGFSQRETVSFLASLTALLSLSAIVLATGGIKRSLVVLVVMIFFIVFIKGYRKNKSIATEYLKKIEEEKYENGEDSENERMSDK